ncbi:MAG: hypothetical protein ACXWNQ_04890 [Anaerolineales bacterium]
MLIAILSWIAVVIVTVTSAGILLNRDWRWDLGLLTAQYVGVTILVGQHWPLGMAAAKLVTGWMATAALGITLTSLTIHEEPGEGFWPQGRAFRLFMVGMILVLTLAVTPRMQQVLSGIGAPVVAGAIILTGTGLLQLGTSSQILRVIFALLTVLAGFEILYAAVEGSILVAALLAVVNLGLGLVGAYLLNASIPEEIL